MPIVYPKKTEMPAADPLLDKCIECAFSEPKSPSRPPTPPPPHRIARWHGIDPADMLRAKTMAEQRTFFDTALSPLFDRRVIKWAAARKAS